MSKSRGQTVWFWWIGFVAIFSLLDACVYQYVDTLPTERTWDSWWTGAMLNGLKNWVLWGLLSVGVFQVVRLMLNRRWRRSVHIACHIPTAIVVVSAYNLGNWAVTLAWYKYDKHMAWGEAFEILYAGLAPLFSNAVAHLAIYTGIVAFCYAYQYYRPALRASQLEARLSRAKLKSLQMQLQPHFLFNTLNSISVLVHKDPDLADVMISRLSELLRLTLAIGDRQQVSLREELEYVDKYVDIEAIRFQDRLIVDRDVGPGTLSTMVPPMILQPLVENSIRHGVSKRAGTGSVVIRSEVDDDWVILEVTDDGPGLMGRDPQQVIGRSADGSGVGLFNVRERLIELYGERQFFEIIPRGDGASGLSVRIGLPRVARIAEDSSLNHFERKPTRRSVHSPQRSDPEKGIES